MAQAPEDRQFLKEFFRAVTDAPLPPDDPRYVPLHESHDLLGGDPITLLKQTIDFADESVQFLTGSRGVGKTTELLRLKGQLDAMGAKVVRVDIRDHVDSSQPINVEQFLSWGFFDYLRALMREHHGGTKLVVIVDSVEHISGTIANVHEVQASLENLFVGHARELRIPGVHIVYTIPPSLPSRYPHLGSLYPSGTVHVLSAVKIRDHDGRINAHAIQVLLDLIKKRHKDASRLLSDDQYTRLILATGGNVRDLLHLVAEVIRRARTLPVDDAVVTEAIHHIGAESLPVADRPPERSRRPAIDPAKLAIGLRSLHLSHIRLFNDLTLDFCRNDAPRPFTLILAENGHGKTTVLQAIALSASGVAGANLLAGNAAAFLDRRFQPANNEELCRIEAHFDALKTELHAPPTWKEFAGSSAPSLDQVRAQDSPQWFVAGYGTSRMLPRSRASKEPGRRAIDRLRSLFDAEPLVATGFADILADLLGRTVATEYAEMLRLVLVGDGKLPGLLPDDEQLHVEALELRGSGSVRESTDLVDADRFVLRLGEHRMNLPASWLSAGYQSTIAWIADLLGQVTLEAGRVLHPHEIAGIVLIDEIDLHLHPHWQASLVPALRAIFPRVQFIATTHSPMVLPGLRQDEIIMLSLDEQGNIRQKPAPVAPALKTGSEILEWFFGIDKLYPAKLGQALQEYTRLASDSERNDDEDARMQTLRRQLLDADADPGWEPVERIHTEE